MGKKFQIATPTCLQLLVIPSGFTIDITITKGWCQLGAPSIAPITSSHKTWLVALMGQKKRTWHDASQAMVVPSRKPTDIAAEK